MKKRYFSNINHCFSSPWLAIILILLTASVMYSNIYSSPFVFDDIPQIEEKREIRYLNNYY